MRAWASESRRVDVVILTALRMEFDAVLQVDAGAVPGSTWELDVGPSGLPVAFRSFAPSGAGADRALRIAVAKAPDAGATAATETLLPLIEAWRPRCIAMCGVCAGRRGKTQLGDVVAAERLFYRDTGKQLRDDVQQDLTTYKLRDDWKAALEGMAVVERFRDAAWFRARPLTAQQREDRALLALRDRAAEPWVAVDPTLDENGWRDLVVSLRGRGLLAATGSQLTDTGRQRIDDVLFEHRGRLPDLSPAGSHQPFRLHVAPLGSGAKIAKDESIWAFVSHAMRKTLALETEAAALGELAHRQRQHRLDAVVMKGVMDFAVHGHDSHFQQFAARASAECLLAFLRDQIRTEIIAGFDDLLTPGTSEVPVHGRSPSALLLARHTVVPWYDGDRRKLLAGLDAWADDAGRHVAVKLLHAGGGVGKTRLAIEWVQRRRRRGDVAGFLAPKPHGAWLERLCGLGAPVLIVIDYAERRCDLVDLLERVAAFAAGEGPRRRVRILLLARNDGDWWTVVRGCSGNLGELLGGVVPHKLSPLAASARDRESVFRQASAVFARELGRPDVPEPPIALNDGRFDRVLYLHMAALAAVEGADFDATSLMDVILDHEERFWLSEAEARENVAVRLPLARQIMAAATLRGALATQSVASVICERLLGRPRDGHDDALLQLLHHVYERANEPAYLPGLEPDLLGEAMVVRVAQPPTACSAVGDTWINRVFVGRDDEASVTTAFVVLGRASVTAARAVRPWIKTLLEGDLSRRSVPALRAAKKLGQHSAHSELGALLADALEQHGTNVLAIDLECEKIPSPSVSLQRVATWCSGKLLAALPLAHDGPALSERAAALAQKGVDLDAAGHRSEAVVDLHDAVNLYRRLIQHNPDELKPRLAATLNNLGNSLRQLGQHKAAHHATREAVRLYREMLLERNPRASEPGLARSLNNLGAMLNALGRHREALGVMREAVDLYRELAKRDADAFQAALATSLNNLGNELSGQGHDEEAKLATREAVLLYRALATQNPDAFEPDLAAGYNNLGIQLSRLGQPQDALKFTSRAVELYRLLAARNPDAFEAQLAISLNNLGLRRSDLKLNEDALLAISEAVVLYQRLAERNPDAFRAPLAVSLNNLGNQLGDLGRLNEALAATSSAVELYRKLVQASADADRTSREHRSVSGPVPTVGNQHPTGPIRTSSLSSHRITLTWEPNALRRELARSLTLLSARLSKVGRQGDAVTAAREAVKIYGQLAKGNREAFEPDLARSLNHLGDMLSVQPRWQSAALTATRKAVELCRQLVARDADAFTVMLAKSLDKLSNRLSVMGHHDRALEATGEAVAQYRELARRYPEAFESHLAHTLNVLGIRLREVERCQSAIEAAQEAVALYRKLVAAKPADFRQPLAAVLNNLGALLAARGEGAAALAATLEAVQVRRALADCRSEALPLLATSLSALSDRFDELGRADEALAATREAIQTYRTLSIRNADRFQPELVRSLYRLGERLRAPGQEREAFAVVREAIELCKGLAERQAGTGAFTPAATPANDAAQSSSYSAVSFYRMLASGGRRPS